MQISIFSVNHFPFVTWPLNSCLPKQRSVSKYQIKDNKKGWWFCGVFFSQMFYLIALVSYSADKAWYYGEHVMLGIKGMICVRNAFVLATCNYTV